MPYDGHFLECMLVLICKTQPEFIQHLRNFDGPRQTQRETAEPARKPRPGPPRSSAGDLGIAERVVSGEGGGARTGGGGDVALGVEVWRLGLMAATKSGAGARRRRWREPEAEATTHRQGPAGRREVARIEGGDKVRSRGTD